MVPAVRSAKNAALATALLVLLRLATLSAADVTGTWALEFQRDANSPLYAADCSLRQEGERFTGSCLSGFESIVPIRGTIQGANVTFQLNIGADAGTIASFTGQLDAQETSMKGTWRFADQQGNSGDGTFTAAKR